MALIAISFAATGVHGVLEYMRSVLPSYSSIGLNSEQQYSLDALLYQLGMPKTPALIIGDAFYIAVLAIGILVAGHLYRRSRDAALVVLVAPVFGILGTTYLHITQVAVMLPALLAIFPHLQNTERSRAVYALLLLQTPWIIADSIIDRPFFAICAGVLYGALLQGTSQRQRTAGVVAGIVVFIVASLLIGVHSAVHAHVHKGFVLDRWILKLPTAVGMVLACWTVATWNPRAPLAQQRQRAQSYRGTISASSVRRMPSS